MTVTVVVGGFYGDEGKGKIVSSLAQDRNYKISVRGGVGPNAGHTVIKDDQILKLRMLPSAAINPDIDLMIGAGVLINPDILLDEINRYNIKNRVLVDGHCAIITKDHIQKDSGEHFKSLIGTTGTGTGPANSDRVLRTGKLAKDADVLHNVVGDVSSEVNGCIENNENVLVEGTQGTFLSLFYGEYPFVTSKDVSASAICSDVGIGPTKVDEVVVVFKSYVTRVGHGELKDELTFDESVSRGWNETGTVTGRQRRSAPFDFDLAKKAVNINGGTEIALTKLDLLFPESKGLRVYEELNQDAKSFIKKIEDSTGIPVKYIGTGPDLQDTIIRDT